MSRVMRCPAEQITPADRWRATALDAGLAKIGSRRSKVEPSMATG